VQPAQLAFDGAGRAWRAIPEELRGRRCGRKAKDKDKAKDKARHDPG
jgi:hypothetical protein